MSEQTKLVEVKVLMRQSTLDRVENLAKVLKVNRTQAIASSIAIAHDLLEKIKKNNGKLLMEYPNHRQVELILLDNFKEDK